MRLYFLLSFFNKKNKEAGSECINIYRLIVIRFGVGGKI